MTNYLRRTNSSPRIIAWMGDVRLFVSLHDTDATRKRGRRT